VRRALIGYLRWLSRRHWSVKVLTIFLILPIWAFWPAESWNRLIEEVHPWMKDWHEDRFK
jgi:hypothetical protein